MEYDLRAIVAEALKEYLPLLSSGKDRFTAEDIAERSGNHLTFTIYGCNIGLQFIQFMMLVVFWDVQRKL